MKRRVIFAIFVLGVAFLITYRGAWANVGGAGKTLYFPLIAAPQPLEYEVADFIVGAHIQEGTTREEALYAPFHDYNTPWKANKSISVFPGALYFSDPLYEYYRSYLEMNVPGLTWEPEKIRFNCHSGTYSVLTPEIGTFSIHKGTWTGSLKDVEGRYDAAKYHWEKWREEEIDHIQQGPDGWMKMPYDFEVEIPQGEKIVDDDQRIRLVFRFRDELTWEPQQDQEIRWGCGVSSITLLRSSLP